MKQTAVILPCAGAGTRLGLPYPKEIHRISTSKSLIDFSLGHIEVCPDLVQDVVTVLAPGKESVFDYVSRSNAGSGKTSFVYFDDSYSEWPGSIKSAESKFAERNIALLPDSVLSTERESPLIKSFHRAFDAGADLVFAYVQEERSERLKSLGALRIESGRVTKFCDKPTVQLAGNYNGFWTAFGFRRQHGPAVLDFMMKSVSKENVNIMDLGLKIQAFKVQSYLDLGTWSNIAEFLNSEAVLH